MIAEEWHTPPPHRGDGVRNAQQPAILTRQIATMIANMIANKIAPKMAIKNRYLARDIAKINKDYGHINCKQK